MRLGRAALVVLGILGAAAQASAQVGGIVVVGATDPSTNATVTKTGDATNNALRVNLVGTNSVRIQDGSGNNLTSLLTGSLRPLTVAVVDASGNQVTAFGGAGGTASNFTSALPASGTAVGFSDGTNMQAARVFDLDTGGGTQYAQGINLRISGAGGSIEAKGAQTSANSLPVVLATDQSAIPVSESGAWSVRTQDGSGNNLTSLSVGSQRAITVAIVDGSGAQITSFGGAGGTASNFGSAFPSAGTAIGGYDGTNMQGARVIDADTSGGTFYTVATNSVFRTSGTPVEAGTSSNPWNVVFPSTQNVSAAVSSEIPGTGATNLGKAEDAAHTSGDVGVMLLGVRESTSTDLSAGATNGDYEPIQVDASGRLWTNPFPASPSAATYLPIRPTDGTNFITPGVDYTHDAALTIGSTAGPAAMWRASSTAPTSVSANDDAVMGWALLNGSPVMNLAAGSTLITSTGTSLNMNCTGGCAGGVQYAEDTPGADADTVTLAGFERQDTIASNTSADGDRTYGKVNSVGALYTSVSHLGANAILTGNGVTGTGSMRVTLASDTSSNTNAFLVNLGQVNGNTALAGNGVTGTGSPRVTIASDNSPVAGFAVGATGSAVPVNAIYTGGIDASGNLVGDFTCSQNITYDASTSGSTELVAISASKTTYVCGYELFAAGTVAVKLIRGTGTACATGSANLTPAYQFTAQTGKVSPYPTHGYLFKTSGSDALCLNTSAGVAVQAHVYYEQR